MEIQKSDRYINEKIGIQPVTKDRLSTNMESISQNYSIMVWLNFEEVKKKFHEIVEKDNELLIQSELAGNSVNNFYSFLVICQEIKDKLGAEIKLEYSTYADTPVGTMYMNKEEIGSFVISNNSDVKRLLKSTNMSV